LEQHISKQKEKHMQTETTNFLDDLLAEVELKEQQQSEAFLI
jgi:hypothetical protein